MTSYLYLKVADYDLLVDTARVREVLALGNAGGTSSGHRAWRGDTLRVFDLAAVLGRKAGCRPATVVLDDGQGGSVYLDVDAAVRILRLEEDAFQPLPPLSPMVEATFDGIALTGDRVQGLLRLKPDSVLEATGPDGTA